MKIPCRRLPLLLALLGAGALADTAPPLAVVQGQTGGPVPDAFERLIDDLKTRPDVDVIRLQLDDYESGLFAARVMQAAKESSEALGHGAIAVVYPDLDEPYRSVFTRIIRGIEDRAQVKVASHPLRPGFDAAALSRQLKQADTRVVIALGHSGLKAAAGLDRDINVVAGGLVAAPDDEDRCAQVLSLAPDPALLFARLRGLSPGTRRIFTAYDPRQNDWLLQRAREAARSQGLELVAREASDPEAARNLYREFFAMAGSGDAVWLPQDSVVAEESAALPLILEEAWRLRIPVFSSSLAHVKRGALFALYPNSAEIGRNLAASALRVAAGNPASPGVQPLRDVMIAVNIRTASHLGLNLPPCPEQAYDLVFP